MTTEEAEGLETRLADIVFSLNWFDEKGKLCHGTGFFISADGKALTAFHNLSPDLMSGPDQVQTGLFQGAEVAFRWVAEGETDRAWQKKRDIAILRADPAPTGLSPLKCYYVPSEIRKARGSAWAENEVAMLGYPARQGFARNLITGRVDRAMPLRDHRTDQGYEIEAAIQIGVDLPGGTSGLGGMSGSPVYDARYGGIVGLTIAVNNSHASAAQLLPVAECWDDGKELLTRIPVHLPPPDNRKRMRWRYLAAPLVAAGLWWYGRLPKPIPKRLSVDVVRLNSNRREPLLEGSRFVEGERVRFLIASPTAGYLYVVDQELNRKGEPRSPELIFPTTRTGRDRNRVSAGVPIPFPAEDENPPYLEPKPEGGNPDYGGELLTVLVYSNPLRIELQPNPIPVTADLIPLNGIKPRTFVHPVTDPGDALAVRQIRVSIVSGK